MTLFVFMEMTRSEKNVGRSPLSRKQKKVFAVIKNLTRLSLNFSLLYHIQPELFEKMIINFCPSKDIKKVN